MALSSKLEDFLSPFLAVFPPPPVLPKEGQHLQWEKTLQKPFFLPATGVPTGPGGIRDTMNCWATGQGTLLTHSQLFQIASGDFLILWQLLSGDLFAPLQKTRCKLKHRDCMAHWAFSTEFLLELLQWVRQKKPSHFPKESTLQPWTENKGMKLILGRQKRRGKHTYLCTKRKLSLLISQITKEEADLFFHLWLVLTLSHKSLQPTSLRKSRQWPPKNTNPAMGLAENEKILLSKLRLGYDIWNKIWHFPQKVPCGRGRWLCSQLLQGQEIWGISRAESSPGAEELPLWLCSSAASPLLQVLWSCSVQNKMDQ